MIKTMSGRVCFSY